MGSLVAGQILAGRYRLVSPLGRGAMGEVWKAEHTALGAPVAIKVIVDAGFDENNPLREELVRRFFREAQAAAAMRSPHVVQILDHGVDGVPYIAMELLEGETLEDRLEREGVLPPHQTAEIITHVARAISKAHEVNIIHRDLKPGNVFLVRNDDEEIAKVLDFGIAKVAPVEGLEHGANVATRTGSLVGTPCYMSPEQALGNKTIDYRSDLWSLAVIAFECVCGVRPFDSEALGDLIVAICAKPIPVPSKMARAPIPEGFDAWWAKAASRDPEHRFQSARELADSLRVVLAPDTIPHKARLSMPSISSVRPLAAAPDSSPRSSGADALAQTAPGPTATHMGVVSAIGLATRNKRKRPALLAGAGLVLAALLTLGFMLGRTISSEDPAKNAERPQDSADLPGTATAAPQVIPTSTAQNTPSAETTASAAPVASASAAPAAKTSAPVSTFKPKNPKPVPTRDNRLGF